MLLLEVSQTLKDGFVILALGMGWILTILFAGFALAIIYKMIKGDIDLRYLIAGADGDASLSRFQFLIFTFVIAMGLFLIIVSTGSPAFPAIPGGILALLGISGGSYVTSKAVDANAAQPPAPIIVPPAPVVVPPPPVVVPPAPVVVVAPPGEQV